MPTDTTPLRHHRKVSVRANLGAATAAFADRANEIYAENTLLDPLIAGVACRDAADKLWDLRTRTIGAWDGESQEAARACAEIARAVADELDPSRAGRALFLTENYARLCDQAWNGWNVEPSALALALRLAVCELRRIERECKLEVQVVEQKHVAQITRRALVMRPFRCIHARPRQPARARSRDRRSHRVVAAKAAATGDPDSSDGEPPGDRARLRAVPVAAAAHGSRGAA